MDDDARSLGRAPDHVVPAGNGLASLWQRELSARLDAFGPELLPAPFIGRSIVLIAEPGMGKTTFARLIALRWRGKGSFVTYCPLRGLSGCEAMRAIKRHVDEVRTSDGGPGLVILDDVQLSSVEDLSALRSIVGDARAKCVSFVIIALPEFSDVLTCVPRSLILDSSFLVFRVRQPGLDPSVEVPTDLDARDVESLTHGIPALLADIELAASVGDQTRGQGGLRLRCPSIHLRGIVLGALRSTLPEEERARRLCMVLLGSGMLEEVRSLPGIGSDVGCVSTPEAALLFGIDEDSGTFSCAGVRDDGLLRPILPRLKGLAGRHEEDIREVAGILARRGALVRAVMVVRELGNADARLELALTWPFEIVDSGEVGFLRGEVGGCPASVPTSQPGPYAAASAALAWAEEDWDALVLALSALPTDDCDVGVRLSEQVRYAVASCGVTRSMTRCPVGCESEGTSGDVGPRDPLASLLSAHARVLYELFSGRYEEALRLALEARAQARESLGGGGTHLLASIASEDLRLVRGVIGDTRGDGDDSSERDRAGGFRRIVRGRVLAGQVLALLEGRITSSEEVERAVAASERKGRPVLAAALLMASVLGDLTSGAFVRAFVRCRRAAELAEAASATFLWRQASLVGAVIDADMGNEAEGEVAGIPAELERPRDGVGAVEWLLAGVARSDGRVLAHSAQVLRSTRMPLEWRRLIVALVGMGGSVSETLRNALPSRWQAMLPRRRVEAGASEERAGARGAAERDAARTTSRRASPGRVGSPDDRGLPPLRINLLGGFEVLRGDVPVVEGAWKRRRAKLLLALLVAAEGHSLSRADAVSSLWPDCDYLIGRDRLYVTLGALRRALGQPVGASGASGPTGRAGYVEGADGRLWLNPSLVSCDLDEFVVASDRALARNESDVETVRRCLSARELYVGDLTLAGDTSGVMLARREEERRRFADVMVAGSEASLRLGSASRAEWFAHIARKVDGLREDIAQAQLKALFAQGRVIEARREYERYAQGLIEATGLPPSSSMRRLVDELGVVAQASERRSA